MHRIYPLLIAALGCLSAAPLAAHPHVFVDTRLALEVDAAGLVQAVEVSWTYDEFETLLVLDEWQLDPDYDGSLSAEERAALTGFDLNWGDLPAGDLFLSLGPQDGSPTVALGAPEAVAVTLAEGRITSVHRRALTAPVAADGLVLRAYDPTFFKAYTLIGFAEVPGCAGAVTPPDLNAAYSLVEELLFAMPESEAEASYPKVGRAFADTVQLRCGGS